MSKKTVFQDTWLLDPTLLWAQRVKDNVYSCYCKICKKSFNLSNMGKSALLSQMDGNKHAAALLNLDTSSKMDNYLTRNNAGIVFVILIQNHILYVGKKLFKCL